MQRILCNSKIHGATITQTNLNYEGSISIDETLLKASDILPYERVQVVNLNNGQRFETYVIRGEPDSCEISLNGPAARLGQVGDTVHILSYILMEADEASFHEPKIIRVDHENRIG
ncbi:MAG: aspartate 1-decarboxylase [Gemmatimonadota bacterium]|nr:MAG: aspartate 1-decarboxylase [Gemmatimonadota bacterium]